MLTLTILSQAEGLDWSNQRLMPKWHWPSYGGMYFGWLAVWVLSPDWRCRKLEVCDFCQALMWSRQAWGRGMRAVPLLCIVYPDICLTTEEKSHKNLSQGIRKAHSWPVLNTIRLVDLVIVKRWPWLVWRPLPPLAFTSGDGVSPRSV